MAEQRFTVTLERADWSEEERRRRVARAYARILALPETSHAEQANRPDRTPAGT